MSGKRRKRDAGGMLAPGRQEEEGDEGEKERRGSVPESLLIRDYGDAVAATPFLPPPI